jgi:hypothetical protein
MVPITGGLMMQSITDEEYKQFRAEQKAQREAYRNNYPIFKTVTTRKPHVCENCGNTIPEHTQAKTWAVLIMTGYPLYFVTKYSHITCPREA